MTSNDNISGGPHEFRTSGAEIADHVLGKRVSQAAAELQEAMDTALVAGLIVEPKFAEVNNRITRFGTRIDSPFCTVRVYRSIT